MLVKHVEVCLNSYYMQFSHVFDILTLYGVITEIYSEHVGEIWGERKKIITYISKNTER